MNDGMVLARRDYTYAEPTIIYQSGALRCWGVALWLAGWLAAGGGELG